MSTIFYSRQRLPDPRYTSVVQPQRCIECGMPLLGGVGHNCPALTTMPSRDFLIRQACLNWAHEYAPAVAKQCGAGYVLGTVSIGGTVLGGTPEVVRRIQYHYRVLVVAHGGQPCR